LGQLIGGTSTAEEPLVITAPGTEINRLTFSDWQSEQTTAAGFWVFLTKTSLTLPQSSHLYSYIGILITSLYDLIFHLILIYYFTTFPNFCKPRGAGQKRTKGGHGLHRFF
jgi:hypothetical protein